MKNKKNLDKRRKTKKNKSTVFDSDKEALSICHNK